MCMTINALHLAFGQVTSSMKILMTDDSNEDDSNSFLLDDNSRLTTKMKANAFHVVWNMTSSNLLLIMPF